MPRQPKYDMVSVQFRMPRHAHENLKILCIKTRREIGLYCAEAVGAQLMRDLEEEERRDRK